MKTCRSCLFAASLAVAMFQTGCGPARIVERDRYFKPVIRHVQPLTPSTPSASVAVPAAVPAQDPMVKILEGALADSRRELLELRLELMSLRDSVRVFGAIARYQREASSALADKVAVLEQQMLASTRSASPISPGPAPAPLARREAPPERSQQPAAVPSSGRTVSLAAEYSEGVMLFNRKQYDEARRWFSRLLEDGISEDLADNCEYWVGECDFARGRFTDAVGSFERVLALKGSNKRADALLMLGRSYEQLRQTDRARGIFERLVKEYPSSAAAKSARWKLRNLRTPAGTGPGSMYS